MQSVCVCACLRSPALVGCQFRARIALAFFFSYKNLTSAAVP
jgi:hypothetical protein